MHGGVKWPPTPPRWEYDTLDLRVLIFPHSSQAQLGLIDDIFEKSINKIFVPECRLKKLSLRRNHITYQHISGWVLTFPRMIDLQTQDFLLFILRECVLLSLCFCVYMFSSHSLSVFPPSHVSWRSIEFLNKLKEVQSIEFIDLMDNMLLQGKEQKNTLQQIFGMTRVNAHTDEYMYACIHVWTQIQRLMNG